MKKMVALCAAIMLMIGSTVHVSASVTTDLLFTMMQRALPNSISFSETVCLGETLAFSIPEDWKKVPDSEIEEGIVFQYEGVDGKGMAMRFYGLIMENMFGDYNELKAGLEKMNIDYISFSHFGVDMILTGDDTVAAGMCLTANGKALCFGFDLKEKELIEISNSDKLLGDMVTIIYSIEAVNEKNLLHFDDCPPEENQEEDDFVGYPFPVYPTIAPPSVLSPEPTNAANP